MKKLISFLTLSAFIFYANAQIGLSPIHSTLPKELKSKEKAINPDYLHLFQKSYERMGKYHSSAYLINLIANTSDIEDGMYPLLPDSCLTVYIDDNNGFSTGFIGFGMNFDPYSESFSTNLDNGLLPSPPNYTYPYKLDSVTFRGAYFMGSGYNAASPDTLRVYVSYYQVYKKIGYRTDYYTIYYLTDVNKDTMYLGPCVNVTGYENSKGGVIKPKVDNTITIDYILTDKDTSRTWDSAGQSWYRYVDISIPMTYNGITEDGFEVPYGAVLSVMPTFVPGYDYELGDTLYYGLTDPGDTTVFADGYPIRVKNYFSMRYLYMDSEEKYFADPFGYNNAIIAYRALLYQQYFKDDGVTRNFRDSSYSTQYGIIPDIYFTVSVDTTIGGDDFPDAIIEQNDLVSTIYPNPANDNITIQLKNSDPATISIINILGQEVKSTLSNNLQTTINISDLKAGMYFVRIDQKGKRFTSKISIQ